MPLKTIVVIPFVPLTEIAAHEQYFFSRMSPHIGIQQPQVGELLPPVTGHLIEQGAFAMDDFVMGQWQNKIFGERVNQAER